MNRRIGAAAFLSWVRWSWRRSTLGRADRGLIGPNASVGLGKFGRGFEANYFNSGNYFGVCEGSCIT